MFDLSQLTSTACRAALLTTLFASTVSISANAQDPSDETAVLEEVIVTAQLRSATAQDSALALSAITGEQLIRSGIVSFDDIVLRTPGLDFQNRGPNKNNVSIRGVSNGLAASEFQRNNALVGMFLDDVSIITSFSNQRGVNLFDMERVEVVRGPQGTLYGEGTVGGAIRYVVAEPSLQEFSGRVSVSLGNTDGADGMNQRYDATISIPVVEDVFGVRLTAFSDRQEGFIDYTLAGVNDANNFSASGFRAVALWQPADNFSAKLTVTEERSESDALWVVTNNQGLTNNQYPALSGNEDDLFVASLRMDYTIDQGTFSAISGFVDREVENTGMEPAVTMNVFAGAITAVQDFSIDDETFTQELRFVSSLNGRFNYVVGAYYKNFETVVPLLETIPALGFDDSFPYLEELETYDGSQIALFAEGTLGLSETLNLTVGLRYMKEDVDSTQVLLPGAFTPIPVPFNANIEIEAWLPKIGLEYRPTENLLAYGTYSGGARNGGLNVTSTISLGILAGVALPRSYDEDGIQAYELGVKSSWLDNRLTANFALYYNDWSDFQTTVSEFIPAFGFSLGYFANAGGAETKGAEMDINWLASDNLTIYMAGNYTTAELTSDLIINNDPNGDGDTSDAIFSPAGTKLAYVPEYSVAAGFDWVVSLADQFDLTIHGDLQHTGPTKAGIEVVQANAPEINTDLDSYRLVNLRAAINSRNWMVTLFVFNLTNELVQFSPWDSAPGSGSMPEIQNYFSNRPRTVGVQLSYAF